MDERHLNFIELLLANGLRYVGDEKVGERPADLARRVGLTKAEAITLCSQWCSKGWYVAQDAFLLHGMVTPRGYEELRKLL